MGRRPLVQTSVADTLTISSLSVSVLLSLSLMVANRWPCQVRRYCFACCYQSEQGERGPWVFLNSDHGVDGETDGHSIFKLQASRMRSSQLWHTAVGCNEGHSAARDARLAEKRRLGNPCDVRFAHGLCHALYRVEAIPC